MNIKLELNRVELQKLVQECFEKKLGDVSFDPKDINIETKSKQNWKSEWESADFRATLDVKI